LKIKITTNVFMPEKAPEKGELEIEPGETLGAALLKLSRGTNLETVVVVDGGKDETITIDDMWEVRVNGRACYSFPDDLKIRLNASDVVTLWLTPLGGG
jgi:hypothetical protein